MAAFALSLLGYGNAALKAILAWLSRRSLAEIACIIMALSLVVLILNRNHWKSIATQRQAQLVECQKERASDRAAYTKAQADAKAANDAQLARVKSEQQGITAHVEQSYESDLARLRAELAKRLPSNATTKGSAGNAPAPDLPNAAPVADDPSRVSIPTQLYVRGAELELQLERLQQWVREQVAVDPNK